MCTLRHSHALAGQAQARMSGESQADPSARGAPAPVARGMAARLPLHAGAWLQAEGWPLGCCVTLGVATSLSLEIPQLPRECISAHVPLDVGPARETENPHAAQSQLCLAVPRRLGRCAETGPVRVMGVGLNTERRRGHRHRGLEAGDGGTARPPRECALPASAVTQLRACSAPGFPGLEELPLGRAAPQGAQNTWCPAGEHSQAEGSRFPLWTPAASGASRPVTAQSSGFPKDP